MIQSNKCNILAFWSRHPLHNELQLDSNTNMSLRLGQGKSHNNYLYSSIQMHMLLSTIFHYSLTQSGSQDINSTYCLYVALRFLNVFRSEIDKFHINIQYFQFVVFNKSLILCNCGLCVLLVTQFRSTDQFRKLPYYPR